MVVLSGELFDALEVNAARTGNHKRAALRPHLAETGALDYAYRRAEDFAARARAELEALHPSPSRTILQSLCARVVHRSS